MKCRIMNFRYTRSLRVTMLLSFVLSMAIVGCGPSRQDRLMQMAMRSRGDDEEEPKPEKKPEPKVETPSEEELKPEPKVEVKEEPKEKTKDVPDVPQRTLVPLEERKNKATGATARAMAAANLATIAEAMLKHIEEKGSLPSTNRKVNGYDTLSWRVHLLPYLGYQDLYEKFDPKLPWDKSPNKELIKFIPDEYVSPGRPDYQTNILMPAHRSFIGGEGGGKNDSQIEDGLANTLLLVEANDDWATPWTRPKDFAPSNPTEAKDGLIGKRKDGAFAVWCNGWTVLLSNDLPDKTFWDAMTYEAGDGLVAGKIHRDIPVAKISKPSVAAKEVKESPKTEIDRSRPSSYTAPAVEEVVRERVPTQAELADAQSKLRRLYADKMKDAVSDQDKLKISSEMLRQAQVLETDSVGAFALQTASMRLSVEHGGVEELVEGVDQRIGRYEVDAYEENKKWLLDFGKAGIGRNAENLKGMQYVKRAIKVMYAGIYDDDYLNAAAICRYAYRFVDQEPGDPIPKKLNRLRTLLGTSKRAHDAASEALADLRNNPADKDAATKVGQYLCFIKGDWKTGLPLLRKGSSRALAQIAALDIAGARDIDGQVAIGDAWWDLAEKARTGVYRQSSRDRAVSWYEQAIEKMPESLDRLHVKSRLDDAGEQLSTSPLALLEELAEDTSVDLTVSLAAISDVGQGRRNDDDDEEDD